jgi:hypothetical protein
MRFQLDLELMCTRLQKKGRLPNFFEIWSDEVHYIKNPQKRDIWYLTILIAWSL